MPRKLRQLRADLRKIGATIVSQKGSHEKWKHPKASTILELAGPDGKDAHPYQERDLKVFLNSIKESNV